MEAERKFTKYQYHLGKPTAKMRSGESEDGGLKPGKMDSEAFKDRFNF